MGTRWDAVREGKGKGREGLWLKPVGPPGSCSMFHTKFVEGNGCLVLHNLTYTQWEQEN